MSTQRASVHVDLPGRAYDITIGAGLLTEVGDIVRRLSRARRAAVVTDSHVGPLYADMLGKSLQAAGFDHSTLTVPAGDATKSLDQAARLYDALAKARHDRSEPVIALGGGMVGDLAGFVAATWLRGVPFVQCPTTLEADIDASVGGKTAVNHQAGKNLIGAFHQPICVCIDPACLATLSERDFIAGLAESVKHAVIRDPKFFDWHEQQADAIEAQSEETVCELIRRNCVNKAEVVAQDERETASTIVGRAALNFGHTIGHAIEAQSRYALRHGEAVALGMVAAGVLAECEGRFPAEQNRRLRSLLESLRLPVRSPHRLDTADILNRLYVDKKTASGKVRFVLPTRIGHVEWRDDIPQKTIEDVIELLQPESIR